MPLLDLRKPDRYDYSALPGRADFSWPGGKRLAVCICNNIEIFSFLSGLGVDSALQFNAPQNARNYAWRDYGNRVGQWYLFDLLDELGLPASHNVNSLLFENCPPLLQRILSRGDEVIGHGRTNAERQDQLDESEERRLIDEATRTIHRHTGTRPAGWLGPYLAETPVTLDLLKETGYRYVLDWPADDQPYWMKTRAGPLLSVPYSVELNDAVSMLVRQESAASFERMMIDQFDEMLLQSRKYSLVYTVATHSFTIGVPYRLRAFRRALAHVLRHADEIWVTTPGQVAAHFERVSPPPQPVNDTAARDGTRAAAADDLELLARRAGLAGALAESPREVQAAAQRAAGYADTLRRAVDAHAEPWPPMRVPDGG